jgi:hypothetical protein
LKPRLYRPTRISHEELLDDEEELRHEFKRRGQHFIVGEDLPSNDYEWYFLMQHYGAPTRLLDWTDGALLALSFAVEHRLKLSDSDRQQHAAVWVLDPAWLNEKTIHRRYGVEGVVLLNWEIAEEYLLELFEGKTLKKKFPIAIDPTHVSRRLAAQRARFTIHGTMANGIEKVFAEDRSPRISKIIVDRMHIPKIRKSLETCGISYTSLFPDLAGLGKELQRLWSGGSGL